MDSGSKFRIDPTACQYVYNIAAYRLGTGKYRVFVVSNNVANEEIYLGDATFALR
jgi:flagellar basal body rod protein FlgC